MVLEGVCILCIDCLCFLEYLVCVGGFDVVEDWWYCEYCEVEGE